MNLTMIVLGVVLLLVAYFLYQYLMGNTSVAVQNTYLKNGTAPIPMTNYTDPGSKRSSYSFWLFVNNVNASGNTEIFTIANPAASKVQLKLYLTPDTTLQLMVGATTYQVTSNFPLQKWERIDISFDNKTMDVYLDGKLLKSYQLNANVSVPTNNILTFGAINAYISGFGRKSSPMTPPTAWSAYISGNRPFTDSVMPKYGLSVELTKDSVSQKKMSLF
jgi:hypothetical protein